MSASEHDDDHLVAYVAQDVHRALVSFEIDQICRAFHIDGRRPWRSASPTAGLGSDLPDDTPDADVLWISIDYAGT